jgi:hypothetical protein
LVFPAGLGFPTRSLFQRHDANQSSDNFCYPGWGLGVRHCTVTFLGGKNNMRASQILSSVLLGGLFLAGCGDDGDSGDNDVVDSGTPNETETGSEPEPTPPEPTPPEPDVPTDTATEPPTDTSTDTATDTDTSTDTGGTSDVDGGVDGGGVDPVVDGGADAGDGGGVVPPVEVDAGSACDATHNTCDSMASCTEPGDGGLAPVCDCVVGYLGDGTTCTLPATCKEIIDNDPTAPSGTYTLAVAGGADGGGGTLEVFCEMTTAGGGWVEALTGDTSFDPGSDVFGPGYTMPITIDPANGSSMMIDFSDSPMGPGEYSIRLIIEETADDVDPGVTLQQLFTDPELINWDLTANNRAGLTVLQQSAGVAGDAGADGGAVVLPEDCAAVAAPWPGLSAAICGATGTQHLVIQDQSVGAGCAGSTYTIGVSSANNCFGWPEAADGQFPTYVRFWIR